jgi:hypothetical protein
MPATASLSPADRMMLFDSLNFLLMFRTPLGNDSSYNVISLFSNDFNIRGCGGSVGDVVAQQGMCGGSVG